MFHCTPSASTKLGQCNLFPRVQLTLKSGALRSWNGSWTCRVGPSRRSGVRVARISGGTDPSPFPTSSGSSARAAPAPASPPATRPARFRRSRRSLETRRLAPGPTSIRRREGPSPPSRPAASENEILTVHDLHAPSGPQRHEAAVPCASRRPFTLARARAELAPRVRQEAQGCVGGEMPGACGHTHAGGWGNGGDVWREGVGRMPGMCGGGEGSMPSMASKPSGQSSRPSSSFTTTSTKAPVTPSNLCPSVPATPPPPPPKRWRAKGMRAAASTRGLPSLYFFPRCLSGSYADPSKPLRVVPVAQLQV